MTNKESAQTAKPYTFAEVNDLTMWSQQEGWAPEPATVHRLLATIREMYTVTVTKPGK
jgi:hypothetical protein